MTYGKYKDFSNRLIDTMKAKGLVASRSPSGICMKTLSNFAESSEQICRRYIRGDALPDYEKIMKIAKHLEISPGWLLFGESDHQKKNTHAIPVDEELLHYILSKTHHLYREELNTTDDYADFVLELIRDVREINTSKENLQKIVILAINSISNYKVKQVQKVV